MAKKTGTKRVVAKKKALNPGDFKKGNTAGSKSQRKSHSLKLTLAEAFKAAITPKDIKEIAKQLVKDAKKGNTKAAKEVLDRCCGKVKEQIEHSVDKETATLLGMIDGSSTGRLPAPTEGEDAG